MFKYSQSNTTTDHYSSTAAPHGLNAMPSLIASWFPLGRGFSSVFLSLPPEEFVLPPPPSFLCKYCCVSCSVFGGEGVILLPPPPLQT